jgi:hypothetical protein
MAAGGRGPTPTGPSTSSSHPAPIGCD